MKSWKKSCGIFSPAKSALSAKTVENSNSFFNVYYTCSKSLIQLKLSKNHLIWFNAHGISTVHTEKTLVLGVMKWENTVWRKCGYWLFQITNAKNILSNDEQRLSSQDHLFLWLFGPPSKTVQWKCGPSANLLINQNTAKQSTLPNCEAIGRIFAEK